MSSKERKIYLFFLTFGFALTGFFFIWWFQPRHISHNLPGFFHVIDYVLFALLSYVIWYQIVNECFSWFIAGFMQHPTALIPQKGLKVAFLTAFVPGREPYDILEQTLSAMVYTDYPHETWLLDEGDDTRAKEICQRYKIRHFTRKGSLKYNTPEGPYKTKTKGGNYNAWFDQHGHAYDFVAQLDVDFVPQKNYLTRTLGYFGHPEVAFVGTPQVYGNTRDSWIVRGAAEQAYHFYGSMQKGLFGADMTLFIGANHVLRVAAHNDIHGYAGHIVEDHLTGMNLYSHRWKSVYVPETLAVGEGPSTWDAYFSQQMRWAYGLIDILFRQSPRVFPKMQKLHVLNYFLLQQYYFYGLTQVIGIFLLCLYFFFGIEITSMPLLPLLAIYIPLLLFQQIFFVWFQRFNIDPKKEKGLMLRGKLLNWAAWPIYFLAFVGVLIKKRLTYVVTPKGRRSDLGVNMALFYPHLVLGTFTLFCLLAAVFLHRHAPQLVFWAVVNTLAMYGFCLDEIFRKLRNFQTGRIIPRVLVSPVSLCFIGVTTLFTLSLQRGYINFSGSSKEEILSPLADTSVTTNQLDSGPTQQPMGISSLKTHRVLPGETLWTISKKYLGKGSAWKTIQINGQSSTIHPGDIVTIETPKSLP